MGNKGNKNEKINDSRRKFLGKAGLGLIATAGVTILGGENFIYAGRKRRKKVLLGGVFSLTGTFKRIGEIQLDAWKEWIKKVNDAGGLCPLRGRRKTGKLVQLVIADDESSPGTAKCKYEKLIEEDKVDILTRPWLPGRGKIEKLVTGMGVPMIGFTSGVSVSEAKLVPRLIDSVVMDLRDTQQPREPLAIEGEVRDGQSRAADCHGANFSCEGGWWDDYECTQEFGCVNTFNCTYSFDMEDCEGTFTCGAKFQAEGCSDYGCSSMYHHG